MSPRRNNRAPVALHPERAVRAGDLRNGQHVTYDGQQWHIWATNGPRAGTVWLLRHDDTGKAHTVAARIALLEYDRVRQS